MDKGHATLGTEFLDERALGSTPEVLEGDDEPDNGKNKKEFLQQSYINDQGLLSVKSGALSKNQEKVTRVPFARGILGGNIPRASKWRVPKSQQTDRRPKSATWRARHSTGPNRHQQRQWPQDKLDCK